MKKTLVIMAAGMGSRFGGLKQIEPVGPNGEFIIDYSIYDAIQAGFNKVVFIIKKENEKTFKNTIGNRISKYIEVEYAFQSLNDLPSGYLCPNDRIKPWGTSHAIYSIRKIVDEPFVVINADDFYGRESFIDAFNVLGKGFSIIGYKIGNTLSDNGTVKRGVCFCKNNELIDIKESSIEKIKNEIIAKPLNGDNEFKLKNNDLCSMNMLCLDKRVIDYIIYELPNFLDKYKNDILKCEMLIPDSMKKASIYYNEKIKVVSTSSKWYGITYKEDKDNLIKNINNMIKNKIYPEKLWD